jgi:hypothetical protein
MPRYFFHVRDGQDIPDDVGEVLEDREAAQHEATRLAGRLISDHAARFKLGETWAMEVKDENDAVLLRACFRISASLAQARSKQ